MFDLSRVVVEKFKFADAEVPEPTSEIRFVGQALSTFIAWPTHLLKVISKKHNWIGESRKSIYFAPIIQS